MIAKFGTFEYPLAERYRFDAELGRGAMGTVYRARDVRLDRAVAIKMLHATLTNELGVARFQSEIRIAASLHHPNIVSVHDSGEADGRLFYVMDYLDGETLRSRIQREKQLSVDDALLIVEQIAEGLQFAHDRGVVHRDVKPENVLLSDGRARVVDFGLARALGDVDSERLTASGLSVGTPQYLSPEQASAEKEVGPRADQYGLACVLYEMLAGEPPFTGPTATAVAMRHISEVPALLGKRRRTAPANVEGAVARALEKVPADRFGSVREFAAALRAPVVSAASAGAVVAHRRARRLGVPSVMALAVLCVALVGMIGAAVVRLNDPLDNGFRWLTNRSLDTSRYAVLAFAGPPNSVGVGLDEKLRDALTAWTGVSAAGAAELRLVVSGKSGAVLSTTDGRAIARAVGAGRYVMGEVTIDGAQQKIRAEVFDASGRVTAKSATVSIPTGTAVSDSVVAHLAYQLLYDGDEARKDEGAASGTNSRPAFASYLLARAAMRDWNLVRADSELSSSLRSDGHFPQASLALATVRGWMSDDPPEIDGLIARARDGSAALSPRERTHVAALADLVSERFPQACARYDSLLRRDSLDFDAWYGIGECNRRDRAVLANSRSPSGFSFRGSYHRAAAAFARAFTLLPHLDPCCEMRADEAMRRVLFVGTGKVLFGHLLSGDTTLYGAYPELIADTVAFVPRPITELEGPPPKTNLAAVQLQQREFFTIATKRVAQVPNNGDALAELGEAMELLGYPTAVDTVHRARALASTPNQALRFAVYEACLRLKMAVPGNLPELRSIRILAESLMTHTSAGTDHGLVAGLAALVGDAHGAARFSVATSAKLNDDGIAPDIVSTANGLLAYAAVGGPIDSLRTFTRRLESEIDNTAEPKRALARAMYLSRAVALAFPVNRSQLVNQLGGTGELIRAESAYLRGDIPAVRKILAYSSRGRANVRSADRTFDALYPEAWLHAAIGDTSGALLTLSPTLDILRSVQASEFFNAVDAGSLLQAMSLRAQLSADQGDKATARLWARAVMALTDTNIATAILTRRVAHDLAR